MPQYTGVYFKSSLGERFRPMISINGEVYWLGLYEDEVEAAKVRDAAIYLFGLRRAKVNFPELADQIRRDPHYTDQVRDALSRRHDISEDQNPFDVVRQKLAKHQMKKIEKRKGKLYL